MNGGAREVMNDGTRLSISAGQHEEQKWKSRLTFLERMGYAQRKHAGETAQ